jgi:hypothetical protein
MAIEVYEATASRPFAARAASITKNMRERVHGLVALLKDKRGPNGEDVGQQVSSDTSSDNFTVTVTGNQFQTDEPRAGEDDLWSWIEGIDANTWPRYHDGVTATLTDLQELSGDSHPFNM